MIICKYAIEVMWLVLAVLVCWISDDRARHFTDQPERQDAFLKRPHSPALIRPPPGFG
ncbi:MAG: hypothetical protein KAV87_27220 [Desulfobacteraceae bacterium]|nr:hypothetical protein [Desulfobacteraceae bacterium]